MIRPSIDVLNANTKLNKFFGRMDIKEALVQTAIDEDLPENEIINLVDEHNRVNDDDIDATEIVEKVQIIWKQLSDDIDEKNAREEVQK